MLEYPARPRRRSPAPLLFMVLAAVLCAAVPMAGTTVWAAKPPEESAWPQEFKVDGTKLVFYQPQWDALEQDVLSGRSALAVTQSGRTTPIFGAAWIEAEVTVDREKGTVEADKVRIMKVHLPDSTPGEEGRLLDQARKVAKDLEVKTGLETLTQGLQATRDERTQAENLNMNPPRIIFEKTPSTLVVLDGGPKTVKVKDEDLERVVNTPAFMVRDTDNNKLYLQSAGHWYEAKSVKAPWKPIDSPPGDVRKLYQSGADAAKASAQQGDQAKADGGQTKEGPPPQVIVATEPTELIVTDGEPKFAPIAGGDLLYLSNTASDVLMDVGSQKYYVLLSGRWYRTTDMQTGPWEYVRADNLPDAFAKIPPGSAKGGVLASISGTPQAEEAVEDAAVPQTAAVRRDEAQLTVEYDGTPQFKKIPKTEIEYAVNTTTQVLLINGRYYAVDQGVWFESDAPDGPWALADEVPQEVQEIPPDSPAYNTKYVYVYDSNPDVVYYGYLPGYVGSYPYHGTVVWGTGYYYPGWWGSAYYPYPWTWGFSAHYSYGWGWSFGFGFGWGWGYPYYASYPYYWGYPAYAWGYPGWWGPYGHCYYPYGAGAAPYYGAYARGAVAVASVPATRLPQGTNVNLYRTPRNATRTAQTQDKFARRGVSPHRGLTAAPAGSQVTTAPGNRNGVRPGTATGQPTSSTRQVPRNGGVGRPTNPARPSTGTAPGGATVQGQGHQGQGQSRPSQQARPQQGRPPQQGGSQATRPSAPGQPSSGAQASPASPTRPTHPAQPGRPTGRPVPRPSQPSGQAPSGQRAPSARTYGPTRPTTPQPGRVYSRPAQPSAPSQPSRPSQSMRGPSVGYGGGMPGYSRPSMPSGGGFGGRSMVPSAPRGGGFGGGGRMGGGGGPRGGGGGSRGGGHH